MEQTMALVEGFHDSGLRWRVVLPQGVLVFGVQF